jgi:hypothetical protein
MLTWMRMVVFKPVGIERLMMGREANIVKNRKCPVCGDALWRTAKEMRDHINYCRRLEAVGLILPKVSISES